MKCNYQSASSDNNVYQKTRNVTGISLTEIAENNITFDRAYFRWLEMRTRELQSDAIYTCGEAWGMNGVSLSLHVQPNGSKKYKVAHIPTAALSVHIYNVFRHSTKTNWKKNKTR